MVSGGWGTGQEQISDQKIGGTFKEMGAYLDCRIYRGAHVLNVLATSMLRRRVMFIHERRYVRVFAW